MDRSGEVAMVGEADHRLGAFLLPEHRARGHAIIPDELGRPAVGVDLLGELLDLDLIIPHLLAGYGVVDGFVGPWRKTWLADQKLR